MSNVKDSELNISQEILDDLMRALEAIESSTDLEGTAIVSKTGLRVAKRGSEALLPLLCAQSGRNQRPAV